MSSATAAPAVSTPSAPAAAPALSPTWVFLKPYVLGGLAGAFATTCIQPIDMVKVRIQLSGEGGKGGTTNPLKLGREIVKNEGVAALYKGLGAAYMRQLTYGALGWRGRVELN